jgi:hypothetical protein
MGEYTGFIQNPLEVIQRLRNDLGDRYKRGFPVLKELIQNADDAEATHVVFALIPGLSEARHPLLQGDALCIINNGRFETKHDRGIRSYGLSNKVADRTAIGKFGLGMKSVFHFCEAFFFLGHLADRGPIARIVNPWSVPESLREEFAPIHPSWEQFSSKDATGMRQAIATISKELSTPHSDQPFVLWLPLRREAHRREGDMDTGVIVQEFPGDEDDSLSFFQGPRLPMQIADVLPLLRHVEHVSFQPIAKDRYRPFHIEISDPARRLRGPTASGVQSLTGLIDIQAEGEAKTQVQFNGRESHQWLDALKIIHHGPQWPETHHIDDLGNPKVEREKAEPHASVVFTTSAAPVASPGHLTIRWAVFLPLEDDLVSEMLFCGGDQDFGCTLHGYFFVDPGRRGIHGFDVLGKGETEKPADSVDAVRITWNQCLATHGTLPLLLPVLHDYVTTLAPERHVETGRLLAKTITRSQLWTKFHDVITESVQWVLELKQNGLAWSLVSSERPLLPLPCPTSSKPDPTLPWRVFPRLTELEATHTFVAADAQQLSPSTLIAPDLEQALRLFNHVTAEEILKSPDELGYFVDTVALFSTDGLLRERSLQQQVVALVRDGFSQIGLDGIRSNKKQIQRLTGYLPLSIQLRLPESVPQTLRERLLTCSVTLLVLPSELCPDKLADEAKLSYQDAQKLLHVIGDWIQEDSTHGENAAVLTLIYELASRIDGDSSTSSSLMRTLRHQRLIAAFYDGQIDGDKIRAVTLAEIEQVRQASLLFRRGQVSDDQGRALAKPLQQVLTNGRVLVLEQKILALLGFDNKDVMSCDAKGVLHALGSHVHTLREPISRRSLIRQLSDPGNDERAKRGFRFLLHGKDGHWSDLQTPLWFRDAEEGEAWETLWSQLNAGWNLVDSDLAQHVTDPVRQALGVRRIRAKELLDVIKTLKQDGLARIDAKAFEPHECIEILTHAATDEVVWRMLPLHECTDGRRCDLLGERVYLDTGRLAPVDFANQLRIIRRSHNDDLRRYQQRLITPAFDARERLELLLSAGQPVQFVDMILDDIRDLDRTLDGNLRQALETASWLPDDAGAAFKPSDIIDCEDPSGLIHNLATQQQDGAYSFVDLLPQSILQHPGFSLIRNLGLLAQGDNALKTLGLLIGELPDYYLCALEDKPTDLLQALSVLAEMPRNQEPAKGWALLESLTQAHNPEDVARYVYPEMARELDDELEIVVQVLAWIRRLGKPNPAGRAAFNLYLQRFAGLPGAEEKLAALELMDSGGDWRPAKQLCAKAEDIERRFVLHDEHYGILRDLVVPANALSGKSEATSSASSPVEGAALATLLKDYFDTWRDRVPDALIGAFVFVCGTAPEVKQAVEKYKGNRTSLRDWLLAQLPWKPRPGQIISWADSYWKAPEEAMGRYSFLAVKVEGNEVAVSSIIGDLLRVKRGSSAKGFVTVRRDNDDDRILIQLAPVEESQHYPEALADMLRQSIRLVAEQWSDQWLGDLSSLWPELESSDQIAIHVARSLILESLPILATQLKPGRHPGLMSALKAFDQARAKVVEYRGHDRATQFEQERQEALRQIQQLIERDEAARTALLEGVRGKIEEFQYKRESIPFELFQNADDAVYQQLEILRETQKAEGSFSNTQSDPSRFVVAIENEALTFMHWGRPLNATGDPFPGRDRDYHRDLEKMLIVNASNKEPPATGKFGLGFKSVFLVCQEPQIVSGRLSLRILGGMLPMQHEDDRDLRRLLREHAPAGGGAGTGIRLSLDPGSISPLLDRFHRMAGVLCCFAKSIQQIDLGGTTYTWSPSSLEQAPAFGIGSLLVPDPNDKEVMTRIQVMRIDLVDGALLVGLDGSGMRPLPETIPSLWVLAPTSEDAALGVALNGRFDVNAARTSLADREEHNHAVAEALGRVLDDAIEDLRLAVDQDWQTVRHTIGLNDGMTPYDLWYSLWRTLVGGLQKREPSKVRSLVQCVAQVGLGELAWSRPLLPNGLPSAHRAMVRVSDVRLVLRGALSIPNVLEQLFGWNHFAAGIAPQETVSAEIHEWASLAHSAYAVARAQWTSSRLADWVSRLMDDSQQVRVAPEPARIWGAILDSLKSDDLSKGQRKDLDDTEKLFSGALFRDVTGRFAPAAELLMSDPSNRDPEERMRWAFAPDQHRLSADYDEAGRILLRRSRGSAGFKADTRQLARWIRELRDDPERRTAALVYLRDGERGGQVIAELRAMELDGTWLAELTKDSPYFKVKDWQLEQVPQVLIQFMSTESQDRFVSEAERVIVLQEAHRAVDVRSTFLKLRDFWRQHGAAYLKEYEQAVYPGGSAPVDALHLDDDDGKGDRSAWLTLFLLGHFHTMGFGQGHRDQNRGFLEMCRQQGWWEQVFARADPRNNFEAWMGVLDAYIDAQTDAQTYEHWMQRFPAIYRLACYLDDYRELMLGLPTWGWMDGECRLAQDNVLKPRAASKLGGGGISAPPFHKTLGIGACFVVRELLRLKVVDGAKVPHACAYVPTKSVRDLLARWGYGQFEGTGPDIGLSKEIHAILVEHLGPEDARFDGAYDIPLQLMAYEPQVTRSCTVYAS